MASSDSGALLPSNVVVAVGTYDGVLAGWELDEERKFKISFATPVHGGSVRSLSIASKGQQAEPGSLLSCGYDETLKTHDFSKRITSSGEVRTPADFGTPVCSSFAPPMSSLSGNRAPSTHCLLGFSGGKLVIYKKRDWSVQHVLAGHEGGVGALAVHPSGKMALSGGESDGKLKLWDLTKGRLAYVTKIQPAHSFIPGRTHYDAVVSLVWSPENGNAYAFCHGSHVTVRDVASGKDLLDVDLPSRVNQICLLSVREGLFVAAACNDGSLPMLAVQNVDDASEERRAIMAIEPVDTPVAGEERFKCIQAVAGYHVVTANSAGVVSLMNLQGAVNMIMTDEDLPDEEEETPVRRESDEEGEDDEEELAVDIIDSIRLGSGARITCLAACAYDDEATMSGVDVEEAEKDESAAAAEDNLDDDKNLKRKREKEVHMDPEAVERARKLVSKAKQIQKKRSSKKHKTGR